MTGPGPVRAVTARAPAKINLSLRVGPRRRDGYHALATVFHAVHLDEVVTATAVDDDAVTVAVHDEHGAAVAGVPGDASNLAVRAALLLRAEAGLPHQGAHLAVRKTVPVAGGMAGGSADAAATLVACAALWDTGFGHDRLLALAARLGSDVPFALTGGTAVGTGRGDRVRPLSVSPRTYSWVLARSATGLSTPAVYAAFDGLRAGRAAREPAVDPRLVTALEQGRVEALGTLLDNDLQEAVLELRPPLRHTLAAGLDAGARAGQVSGSGPTLMFFVDPGRSAAVCRALARQPDVAGVHLVTGPAPGACVAG